MKQEIFVGREDILVTALTERNENNGRGKVYIFDGRSLSDIFSKSNRQNDYPEILQEIISTTPSKSQLFGFSIGEAKVDLDGNGFYDLVIGDPGKRAQNAHVFYSNNYIRLIHDDAIKKRFRFDYGVDSSCPVSQNFKFCGKIQVVLQNRGVPIFSQVNRKERPTFKKWNFSKNFTVDVRFTKDQTSNSLEQIFVWDGITECKFGPNIDTVETAIFLYGNISEFFGAKISIIAETNVSGNNEISLRESYKGKTVVIHTDIIVKHSYINNVHSGAKTTSW